MKIHKRYLITLLMLSLTACGGGSKNNPVETNKNLKKIFLIGDSTMHIHSSDYLLNTVGMTCGADNPDNILTGWGDKLHLYAKNADNIVNRARAGSSSVSYRTNEGYDNDKFGVNRHWSYTKALMEKEADGFLLIQFGTGNENDQAPRDTDYDNDGDIDRDDETLRIALRKSNFEEAIGNYIKEARGIGFTPILITPPDGRFKGGFAVGTHPHTRGDFPSYIHSLGTIYGVAVLDLNSKSNQEFAKSTDEELLRDFGDCSKRSGTIDRTHYEPKGAKTVASWVSKLACPSGDDNNDRKLLCKQFKGTPSEDTPTGTPQNTVYEDAEDGNTTGWTVFDNHPAGASFKNTFDQNKQSNVIEFTGDATKNGYMLGNVDGQAGAWNNTKSTQVEWSMKYSDTFKVYFNVRTKNWTGYIYYSPVSTSEGVSTSGTTTFLHIGLGNSLMNGTWQTITRDLKDDLRRFEPNNSIIAINGFLIRGNGKIDDIKVLNTSNSLKTVITLNELKAFPTAEGAGAKATGGRNGRVIYVKNRNASGDGSLRAALEQKGRRTIVFAIGGRFNLDGGIRLGHKKTLTDQNDYNDFTLAGQTANEIGGVHLANNESTEAGFARHFNIYHQENMILRYFDTRFNWQWYFINKDPADPSKGTNPEPSLRFVNVRNLIIDHVSSGWSAYGLIILNSSLDSKRLGEITVQRSLMHENIINPDGIKQKNHNVGMLLGARSGGGTIETWNNMGEFSIIKNAFIGTSHRFPNTAGGDEGKFRFINNYIYGFDGGGDKRLARIAGNAQNDLVNNVYQESHYSPNFTTKNLYGFQFDTFLPKGFFPEDERPNFHIDGNLFLDRQSKRLNLTDAIQTNPRLMLHDYGRDIDANLSEDQHNLILRNSPMAASHTPVSILPTHSLKGEILANVGGNIRFTENGETWIDDPIDTRYINWAKNNAGPSFLTKERNDDGLGDANHFQYPAYNSSERDLITYDSDKDGMPNEWELLHKLDPNQPSNNEKHLGDWDFGDYIVKNNAGYTDLEMYLADIAGDFHTLANKN